MCSPIISPLGSLFAGRKVNPGLAMLSPLAALATSKKPKPDRLNTLYPNGG